MNHELVQSFEAQVVKKAISLIDKDALAKDLAKRLQADMKKSMDEYVNQEMDFLDWIRDELYNEKTVAGKAFKKAFNSMAKTMAESITTESK